MEIIQQEKHLITKQGDIKNIDPTWHQIPLQTLVAGICLCLIRRHKHILDPKAVP